MPFYTKLYLGFVDLFESWMIPIMTTQGEKVNILLLNIYFSCRYDIDILLSHHLGGTTTDDTYIPRGEFVPVPDVRGVSPDKASPSNKNKRNGSDLESGKCFRHFIVKYLSNLHIYLMFT